MVKYHCTIGKNVAKIIGAINYKTAAAFSA